MKSYYVYKIINKINNKIYIGKSCDPTKRWSRHKYDAKKNADSNKQLLFHRAIMKYGYDNFITEILAKYDTNQESLIAEKEFIKLFDSNNLNKGYNLTDGDEGLLGYKLTEKQKNSISLRNSGSNNGMYGKTSTIEQRLKKGIKISETKRKNTSKKYVFSQETIEKLKIAAKDKKSQKISDHQKDEIVKIYDTGTIIKKDLASQFDLEEKTLNYIIRYWKKVKNNKSNYLTKDQKNSIINLYLEKQFRKKQIAEKINIPLNRVEAVIKMYQRKQKAEIK